MASSPKQGSWPRLVAALRQNLLPRPAGTIASSPQSSIELQETHGSPRPDFPLQSSLTPAESSTLLGSSTLAKSATPADDLAQTESSPESPRVAHQNPGFQVKGPPKNTPSSSIKHGGNNDFCPFCGKRYTHTTADHDRWLNSEQRVYLCCGHAFGAPCIEEHIAGLEINGHEHRCPMGGCTSIQHECSHINIPMLRPPQETRPSMDSGIIPSHCESCSTADVTKLHTSLTQHNGKKTVAEQKLRITKNATCYVRMAWRFHRTAWRFHRTAWRFQKKWHNWKLNRADRKIDAQYKKYRKHRLDEIERERFLWNQVYVQPTPGRSSRETEILKRSLNFRPDQDVPQGLPLDQPENIPARHREVLNEIREEPDFERIEASTKDKGKGKKKEMGRADKETTTANAPTRAPIPDNTRRPYESMAASMMSNSWNDPPESPPQTHPLSQIPVPRSVRFEQTPTQGTRPPQIPIPAHVSSSLVGRMMSDTSEEPLYPSEWFSEPSSSTSITGQNSSYVNRRVDIGPEVLNHEEERSDTFP
ncbi:hypothetical protein ACHAPU_008285 [Fusarium lateritium]